MGNTTSFTGWDKAAQKVGQDPKGKKLLDRMMDALRAAGFDQEHADIHLAWAREFILSHDKRHPQELGPAEIGAYLNSARFASSYARP